MYYWKTICGFWRRNKSLFGRQAHCKARFAHVQCKFQVCFHCEFLKQLFSCHFRYGSDTYFQSGWPPASLTIAGCYGACQEASRSIINNRWLISCQRVPHWQLNINQSPLSSPFLLHLSQPHLPCSSRVDWFTGDTILHVPLSLAF